MFFPDDLQYSGRVLIRTVKPDQIPVLLNYLQVFLNLSFGGAFYAGCLTAAITAVGDCFTYPSAFQTGLESANCKGILPDKEGSRIMNFRVLLHGKRIL